MIPYPCELQRFPRSMKCYSVRKSCCYYCCLHILSWLLDLNLNWILIFISGWKNLKWFTDGYNAVQLVAVVTHHVMASLLWQTVEQHCAAVLAVLIPVPHGPLIHFVIENMLKTDPVETNPIPAVCLVVLHHLYTQTILVAVPWKTHEIQLPRNRILH